jgi:hypothetical protein
MQEWALSGKLSDIGCDCRTELVALASDGLVGYANTAFREQIFDISQAHRETVLESDHMANDISRRTMSLEGNALHCCDS